MSCDPQTVVSQYSLRRFMRRALQFLVLGILVMNVVAVLILSSRLKPIMIGREVWLAIDHTRDVTSATTLVLGDSVARQLYDRNNERATGFLHATANQSISMAGQEMLLREALRSNPQLKRVILLYHPDSFSNDLDQPYTFNYFAKPFCSLKTWPRLSSLVKQHMERRLEFWAAFLPLVKATQLLSNVDYTPRAARGSKRAPTLAPTTADCLPRMRDLCEAHGVSLELRSPPIAADRKLEWLRTGVHDSGMDTIFAGYFESMRLLPSRLFPDGIHIDAQELPRFRAR